MNKVEAKRKVCAYVGAILTAGENEEIIHDFYDYSEEDQQRLYEALEALQAELFKRARGGK